MFLDPEDAVAPAVESAARANAAEAEYSRAAAIIEAYSRATTVDRRGAVMLGDEMIDEASRKMAQAVLAQGNAAGFARQEFPDSREES